MLWGGKVILSTGTKNLQDQLFLRDIPTVRHALNVPVSVALLKGRANYVCHYHLERAQANGRWRRARMRRGCATSDASSRKPPPATRPSWRPCPRTRRYGRW